MSYAASMISNERSHFAFWLVSWRIRRGYSQRHLASLMGLTGARIAQVETDVGGFNQTGFLKSLRPQLSKAEWAEAKEAMMKQIEEELEGK